MKIGQILWLGGLNKKLNRYNRFGFITDIVSDKELYVNLNGININSEIYCYYKENKNFINSNKFKSDYVCYKLDEEINTAKDVRLCREVKWNEYDIETIKTSLQLIRNRELRNFIIKESKDLIIENKEFFNSLDIETRFQLCIKCLNENKIDIECIIKKFHSIFLDIKKLNVDIISYYNKLPDDIKINGEFLKYLDYIQIFKILWETKFHGMNYWRNFNNQTKIKYVYRLCYSYDSLDILKLNVPLQLLNKILFNETNKLVKGLIYILSIKYNGDSNNFQYAHDLIQEYVIEEIKNSGKVNMYRVTPLCNKKDCNVKFCEGKLWRNKEKSNRVELRFYNFPDPNIRNHLKTNNFRWDKDARVWYANDNDENRRFIYNFTGKQYVDTKQISTYCPRKRTGCDKSLIWESNSYNFDYNPNWDDWNILNLIDNIGFKPQTGENYDYREYAYKLNGWINRLIEMAVRLKCSKCKRTMISNFKYSKKLTAVYNNTVARCPLFNGDSEQHDDNTYFNHCNGCAKIIDSRESKIKQEDTGYYLCIQCGRGKRYHPTFKEGDKCPNCGALHMEKLYNRIYKCKYCGHTIKAPYL